MYTIIVKEQDKQVYKAYGGNLENVIEQTTRFIKRKYQYNTRR